MMFEVELRFRHTAPNGRQDSTTVCRTLDAPTSQDALIAVKTIAAQSFSLTDEPAGVHIFRKDTL